MESAISLLESAKAVRAIGHYNVAFHLVLLAMEEIGKRSLLQVRRVAEMHGNEAPWMTAHSVDHIQKLWWCFFGAVVERHPLTQKLLDSFKTTAGQLHEQRLSGLYVELTDQGVSIPSESVTPDECDRLITAASSRLELARMEEIGDLTPEDLELQRWFIQACNESDIKRRIFGRSSLDKLAEFGAIHQWLKWHRSEIEAEQRHLRELARIELEKSSQRTENPLPEKWRVRIRLLSDSHTVRGKVLTEWNELKSWIRLEAVSGKKDQLFVDFTWPSTLPANALYFTGWGIARHFAVAINIATHGFWWWSLPEQTDAYAERMVDLENKFEIKLSRYPPVRIQWGQKRALSAQDLNYLSQVLAVTLERPRQKEKMGGLDHYLGGLINLAKSDIHMECHPSALRHFFMALMAFLIEGGDVTDEQDVEAVLAQVDKLSLEPEARERLAAACRAFVNNEHLKEGATQPIDAVCLKIICDTYFRRYIVPARLDQKFKRQPG